MENLTELSFFKFSKDERLKTYILQHQDGDLVVSVIVKNESFFYQIKRGYCTPST